MHLRNADNTEHFHVPRSTGRALLETGKFVEVLPAPPPPPQDTKWSVMYRPGLAPMLVANCPNCRAHMETEGPGAGMQRLYHVCFGGPENAPAEVIEEYNRQFDCHKKHRRR